MPQVAHPMPHQAPRCPGPTPFPCHSCPIIHPPLTKPFPPAPQSEPFPAATTLRAAATAGIPSRGGQGCVGEATSTTSGPFGCVHLCCVTHSGCPRRGRQLAGRAWCVGIRFWYVLPVFYCQSVWRTSLLLFVGSGHNGLWSVGVVNGRMSPMLLNLLLTTMSICCFAGLCTGLHVAVVGLSPLPSHTFAILYYSASLSWPIETIQKQGWLDQFGVAEDIYPVEAVSHYTCLAVPNLLQKHKEGSRSDLQEAMLWGKGW